MMEPEWKPMPSGAPTWIAATASYYGYRLLVCGIRKCEVYRAGRLVMECVCRDMHHARKTAARFVQERLQ